MTEEKSGLVFKQVQGAVNLETATAGDLVYLRFDRTQDHGPSASGKTHRVASTLGNLDFNGITVGFNAYKKA